MPGKCPGHLIRTPKASNLGEWNVQHSDQQRRDGRAADASARSTRTSANTQNLISTGKAVVVRQGQRRRLGDLEGHGIRRRRLQGDQGQPRPRPVDRRRGSNASETVTDLLTQMKGKIVASQEANVDRAKIQTDINALRDQIGAVVVAAQFNGLNLLVQHVADQGRRQRQRPVVAGPQRVRRVRVERHRRQAGPRHHEGRLYRLDRPHRRHRVDPERDPDRRASRSRRRPLSVPPTRSV